MRSEAWRRLLRVTACALPLWFLAVTSWAQIEIDLGEQGKVVIDGTTVTKEDDDGKRTVVDEKSVRTEDGSTDVAVEDGQIVIRDEDDSVRVDGDWRAQGTAIEPVAVERAIQTLGGLSREGVVQLNLAGDVLFDFDSAAIKPDAAATLRQVAGVIRAKAQDKVLVIGHTDSRGSEGYNLDLSRRRAEAVMRWLHDNERIPYAYMVGEGVGARFPRAAEVRPDGSDDPQGRARNRRVEIQIATRPGLTLGAGKVSIGTVALQPPTLRHGAGTCADLCAATAGKHSFQTVGCVEGAFEEQGFDMDEGSCDELEDAMALGMGNEGGRLCSACMREQGVTDSVCATVRATCFAAK